jgi:PhnB protein
MTRAIPEGMHSLTPQLTVDNAAAAMELYKKAFGATEIQRAPDPSGKKIWHASMKIGDSTFFVNDAFPEMGSNTNQTRLWFYTETVDAAFKRAIDAGCKQAMPVADMFWGDRMGAVIDPWGNQWTIATHTKDMTPEQQKQAADAFVAGMKK